MIGILHDSPEVTPFEFTFGDRQNELNFSTSGSVKLVESYRRL